MDFAKFFNSIEDHIEMKPETEAAEAVTSALLAKLKEKDLDLYFELDSAIGSIARAYEKQGFAGGLAFAKVVTV